MIEDLIRRVGAEDHEAIEELSAIADSDPWQLTPYLGRLFDLGVLWPPKLYRAADTDVIRRVIERVDSGHAPDRLNHLFLVLAHTGHPLAERAMRRWTTQPPSGADKLYVGPLNYAQEGGWTVDPDGSRRNLCGDTAHQWLVREASRRTGRPVCPWCASPLWTAADLDTADPVVAAALAHTGWSGRLVVETCHFCACYATLYSQVTPSGTATWWTGNTRPNYLPDTTEPEDPPTRLPAVGPARPSPYLASAWNRGGSTVGGRPDWIDDAAHPDCPGCGQAMHYLGLIAGADLYDIGEGAYYLHLHQPCGYAAVNYQQS